MNLRTDGVSCYDFIMKNETITKSRKYFEGRGYHRDYFCNIDTEEKAYILGFLWGDGSYIPSKRTIALVVAVKDESHLRRMATCIGLEPDQVRTHTSHSFGDQEFDYVKIQMSHKVFFEAMQMLGFGKKVDRMQRMPPIPAHLVRHFIRGLFDADGYVYVNPRKFREFRQGRMEVSLRHLPAVQWWTDYLKQACGVEFKHCRDKSIYRVTLQRHDSLVAMYHYLYADSTIYLERKHSRFKSLLGPEDHPNASVLPMAA